MHLLNAHQGLNPKTFWKIKEAWKSQTMASLGVWCWGSNESLWSGYSKWLSSLPSIYHYYCYYSPPNHIHQCFNTLSCVIAIVLTSEIRVQTDTHWSAVTSPAGTQKSSSVWLPKGWQHSNSNDMLQESNVRSLLSSKSLVQTWWTVRMVLCQRRRRASGERRRWRTFCQEKGSQLLLRVMQSESFFREKCCRSLFSALVSQMSVSDFKGLHYVFSQDGTSASPSLHSNAEVVWGGVGFLRNLGSSTELLLLHFSSFTIGRRLKVTVSSEQEKLLQPSKPYCPLDTSPRSAVAPSHVITVSAPRDVPRYDGCCLTRQSQHCISALLSPPKVFSLSPVF